MRVYKNINRRFTPVLSANVTVLSILHGLLEPAVLNTLIHRQTNNGVKRFSQGFH